MLQPLPSLCKSFLAMQRGSRVPQCCCIPPTTTTANMCLWGPPRGAAMPQGGDGGEEASCHRPGNGDRNIS